MTQRTTFGILSIFFVLILLNSASAACNDCVLEIKPTYRSVCRGEPASFNLKITNIYAFSKAISLSAKAEIPITADFPSQVIIEPYKSKTVAVNLAYPADVPFGPYRFTVTASGYGSSDSDDGIIDIQNCHASSLDVISEVSLCEGETKAFEATITNLGSRTDLYTTSLENLPPNVQAALTPGTVTLEPGESGKVSIRITSPGLHFGSFTSKLVAVSSNDYAEDIIIINLNKCHRVDVSTPEAVLIGINEPYYTALVTNNGVADDFALSLDGTCSGDLSLNSIHLEPGESKEIQVRITSGLGMCDSILAAEGSYSRDSSSTSVEIRERYGVELEITPPHHSLCLCEPFDGYNIRIKNIGIHRQTFSLTAEGIPGSLDRDKITLKPGSEGFVFFKQNLNTCCMTSDKELTVIATSPHNSAVAKCSLNLITSDELCADMNIQLEMKPAVFSDCSTGEVLLLLKNTGYSNLRVDITAEGPGNFDIQPREVTLQPFESRPIALYVFPSLEVLGPYRLNIIAKSQYHTKVLALDVDMSYPSCGISEAVDSIPREVYAISLPPGGGVQTPTGEFLGAEAGEVDYLPIFLALVLTIAALSILLLFKFLKEGENGKTAVA